MRSTLKYYKLEKLFGSLFDGAEPNGLKLYSRLFETLKISLAIIILFAWIKNPKMQVILFSCLTILVFLLEFSIPNYYLAIYYSIIKYQINNFRKHNSWNSYNLYINDI